jgi:hypothetical protein
MALTRPRFGQLITTATSLTDNLTVINSAATQANVDVGFIFNRTDGVGSVANVAIYWNEATKSFVYAYTADTGDLTNANIVSTGYANVATGNLSVTGNTYISGNVYSAGSRLLTQADLTTITYSANSIVKDPNYGTYNSGSITSIQTLNDWPSGGYYSVSDGATSPAYILYVDFINVVDFNRVVLNLNYTTNSGHTVSIDIYNTQTTTWDSLTTYSGTPGYFQFALQTITSAPYISAGKANVRIYHSSFGNVSHETRIDYVALEKSVTGGEGPRGATGATGASGTYTGGYVSGITTFGSNLVANSGTISSNVSTGALVVVGGGGISGNLNVGGNITTTGVSGNISNVSYILASGGIYSGNIQSANVIVGTGIYFANGTPYSTGTASVAGLNGQIQYNNNGALAGANVAFFSSNTTLIANANIVSSANVTAANVLTNNLLYANGQPYAVSYYTNANVNSFLPTYTGNIQAGNITVTGNLTVANIIYTNQEIITSTETISGNLVAASGAVSANVSTGALVVVGGAGISGNLNLGTAQSVHHISGNLNIGPYNVNRYSGGDTVAFTINLSPDVPQFSNSAIQYSGGNGRGISQTMDSFGNSASNGSVLSLRRARGTTDAPTALLSGDQIGGMVGHGYGATGYYTAGTLSTSAGFGIYAAETHTDTAQGTFLSLRTTANGSLLATETVRFDSTGNVIVLANTASTSNVTGALVVNGGVGVSGNIYGNNRIGFVYANSVSSVYTTFNQATASYDIVFG